MESKCVDLISNLPDEILVHIIHLIPYQSSVQTLFLSTRWKLLWDKSLLVVQHGARNQFLLAILNFLSQPDNPKKLHFFFDNDHDTLVSSFITPKHKLFLDFSCDNNEQELIFSHFGLKLDLNSENPSPKSLFYVQALELVSLNHSLNNEAISSVVSNFELLETLKISACDGLESLHISCHMNLRSLIIFDCHQLTSLHVTSFKLQNFKYRGLLLPLIHNEYHFNLKEAMLDTRKGPGFSAFKSCDFDSFLLAIKNVKMLTICQWIFEELICTSLCSIKSEFQFYNLKELVWIGNHKEEKFNDILVFFLRLCPSLQQLLVIHDSTSYYTTSNVKYSTEAGRHTKLEKLKVVKLQGFSNEDQEILLVNRLLSTIVISEPLILVTSDGNHMRRLIKLRSGQQENTNKFVYKFVAQDIIEAS